ncbi:hypothetical protein [Roseicella aquatilis]|uniref:hypothetical protein n=1 Tax=Roseicella aquatilis TaxID=2527868 RepID=UPI001981D46E|nr:hypothetical protein [Roseicella aquatilis]
MDGSVTTAKGAAGSHGVGSRVRDQRKPGLTVRGEAPAASVGVADAFSPDAALPWLDLLEYQRDF